jgi:hypothetical protein
LYAYKNSDGFATEKNPNLVFQNIFMIYQFGILHERKVYDFLDLIGDIGGVFEICSEIFGFFILPISYHSFIIKALKKMFLVKSREPSLSGNKLNKVEPKREFDN